MNKKGKVKCFGGSGREKGEKKKKEGYVCGGEKRGKKRRKYG